MNLSPVAKHFDSIAPKYDEYKKMNKAYYNALKHAIRNEVKSNCSILDIGCGTGEVIHFLNPKNGLGIDISNKMIVQANKKFLSIPTLTFKQHDIEQEPIAGDFDYIIFNDVIEHIIDKEKAIKNISLSMSDKTLLIMSMANPLWEPVYALLELLKAKMPEGPHRRIAESELLELFNQNNLRVLSKTVYFPRIPLPIINQFGLIHVYTVKKNP